MVDAFVKRIVSYVSVAARSISQQNLPKLPNFIPQPALPPFAWGLRRPRGVSHTVEFSLIWLTMLTSWLALFT